MITGHLPELFLVLILGLIVFGPKRLPEIGGAMGQGIRDFKNALSHLDTPDAEAAAPAPTVEEAPIPVPVTVPVEAHEARTPHHTAAGR